MGGKNNLLKQESLEELYKASKDYLTFTQQRMSNVEKLIEKLHDFSIENDLEARDKVIIGDAVYKLTDSINDIKKTLDQESYSVTEKFSRVLIMADEEEQERQRKVKEKILIQNLKK